MIGLKRFSMVLVALGAAATLSACGGADEVASPGEGAFNGGTGTPTNPGTGNPAPGTPAADCPTGLTNAGVVANGTLRNCQLPAKITGNLVLPLRSGTVYSVTGRVDVGDDMGGDPAAPKAGAVKGVLTVDPGVKVFGSAGLDYIVVNRGSQIFAQGTATQPIVFTSRQSIEGSTNVDSIGQWGGLVILGRAPISNCSGSGATPGSATCEAQVEGTNAFYGGNSATDSSGVLRYVRVQHSGFIIVANNELNGITFAGVGNGTTVDHIQVHNSSDDGIEWFGGTVNAKYLVLTGNDDDSLDTDVGFNGNIQFVIAVQRANGGNRIVEASSAGTAPRSNPKFANFTFIGRGGAGNDAITMNTSTNNVFVNGLVVMTNAAAGCLDIDDATTQGTFNSVRLACATPFTEDSNVNAAANATIFNAGTNNSSTHTSTLSGTFINGANENAVTPFNVTALSSFFTAANYIGAVRDANDTWWQGWTCGLTSGSTC
ncbi:hypothetical protein [Caulobacter sp. NIBR2454]|uniref:hypothetical protein n=1 Tax=Caulobacter sp. NIBR2454 TaxID=3015996 RepID=UPI0022B5E811|nr:hypothetical protein [Caulobacter sp. NIBR2454]